MPCLGTFVFSLLLLLKLISLRQTIPIGTPSTAMSNDYLNGHSALANSTGRIIRGEVVPEGKYPFLVSIRKNGVHHCGGSILNDDSILTAAHCLEQNVDSLSVYVGHHRFEPFESEFVYKVASVSRHEKFDRLDLELGSDVGVVKLKRKMDFASLGAKVQKVCLPSKDSKPDGTKCVAMGWGRTESEKAPKQLKQVTLPIQPHKYCASVDYRHALLICASSPGSRPTHSGICNGDSGSPYVCPLASNPSVWLQFGVTSFISTPNCGEGPSFFTNVSSFVDWIEDKAE